MQLHAPLCIIIRRREYLSADPDVDVELLAKLASQTRVERLAGVALAAGELPQALEVDAQLTAGDEKTAAALDHRRRHHDRVHDDWRSHAQSFFIGQTRHFGVRA